MSNGFLASRAAREGYSDLVVLLKMSQISITPNAKGSIASVSGGHVIVICAMEIKPPVGRDRLGKLQRNAT